LVAVGRAVHQDVESAEALDRGGNGVAAAGAVGDVQTHRQRLAAAGLDLARRALGARLLDVGARDPGAGRRVGEPVARPIPLVAPTTIAIFFSSVNAGSIIRSSI